MWKLESRKVLRKGRLFIYSMIIFIKFFNEFLIKIFRKFPIEIFWVKIFGEFRKKFSKIFGEFRKFTKKFLKIFDKNFFLIFDKNFWDWDLWNSQINQKVCLIEKIKFLGQKRSIKAKQNKVQIKSNVYSHQKLTDSV